MIIDPVFSPNILQDWPAFGINDRTVFAKQNPNLVEQVVINMVHD